MASGISVNERGASKLTTTSLYLPHINIRHYKKAEERKGEKNFLVLLIC